MESKLLLQYYCKYLPNDRNDHAIEMLAIVKREEKCSFIKGIKRRKSAGVMFRNKMYGENCIDKFIRVYTFGNKFFQNQWHEQ